MPCHIVKDSSLLICHPQVVNSAERLHSFLFNKLICEHNTAIGNSECRLDSTTWGEASVDTRKGYGEIVHDN